MANDAGSNSISVIVPVHNGATTLRECISALRQQTLSPIEIIIADDASTDNTAAIARAAGADTITTLPQQVGPGGARAAGAAVARGNILAFTDADCLPPPEWLARAVAAIAAGAVAATGGYCASYGHSFLELFQFGELAYRQRHCTGAVNTLSGANCLCTATAYAAAGGFLPTYNEDMEFGFRLAQVGRVVWLADNGVVHRFRKCLHAYLRQQAYFAAQVMYTKLTWQNPRQGQVQFRRAAVFTDLASTILLVTSWVSVYIWPTVMVLPAMIFAVAITVTAKIPSLRFLRHAVAFRYHALVMAFFCLILRDLAWCCGLVWGIIRAIFYRSEQAATPSLPPDFANNAMGIRAGAFNAQGSNET